MTQHVKLARDRRRRKSRIKALIFFCAVVCIVAGGILSLKDTVEHKSEQTAEEIAYHTLQNETADKESRAMPNKEESEATSYDDELSDKDDEVDEIKINPNDFDLSEPLPEEAQNVVDNLLDAIDQAKRITDQFNHSVARGDTLKDVLELSGLEDDTSKKLIASYPELKHLKAGQQVYWILDNNNDLEYLNWLVSEKEERVYERRDDGNLLVRLLRKKAFGRKRCYGDIYLLLSVPV